MSELLSLYFSPREAFEKIVPRPRVWIPLLLIVVCSAVLIGIWQQHVDPREFIKAQLEEIGFWDKMPPEAREQAIEGSSFKRNNWFGVILGVPVAMLFISLVYWIIFRFFYGSTTSFAAALGIVSWSSLAVGLVKWPLELLTLYLKGDWNIHPEYVLQASPAAFFERGAIPAALYSLLGSLELFWLWTMFLMAVGFGVATRRTTGSAFLGVLGPWILVVLVKMGWAMMMGR